MPDAPKDNLARFKAKRQRIGSLAHPFKKAVKQLENPSMNLHTGMKDAPDIKSMPAYKKGGAIRKTGVAMVHKGERVISKHDYKKMQKGKSPKK